VVFCKQLPAVVSDAHRTTNQTPTVRIPASIQVAVAFNAIPGQSGRLLYIAANIIGPTPGATTPPGRDCFPGMPLELNVGIFTNSTIFKQKDMQKQKTVRVEGHA
jgi:hypothetical protein